LPERWGKKRDPAARNHCNLEVLYRSTEKGEEGAPAELETEKLGEGGSGKMVVYSREEREESE